MIHEDERFRKAWPWLNERGIVMEELRKYTEIRLMVVPAELRNQHLQDEVYDLHSSLYLDTLIFQHPYSISLSLHITLFFFLLFFSLFPIILLRTPYKPASFHILAIFNSPVSMSVHSCNLQSSLSHLLQSKNKIFVTSLRISR